MSTPTTPNIFDTQLDDIAAAKELIDYLAQAMLTIMVDNDRTQSSATYHQLESRIQDIEDKMSSIGDKVAVRNTFMRK